MWRAAFPAVALLALTGCTATPAAEPTTPPSSTTTSRPAPNPNLVECSNVERAYNAWVWEPVADPAWFRQTRLNRLIEDGADFAKAIKGYQDLPALALNTAVAKYNFDLSVLNATFAARGSADTATTGRIVESVSKVKRAYFAFKSETCRDT